MSSRRRCRAVGRDDDADDPQRSARQRDPPRHFVADTNAERVRLPPQADLVVARRWSTLERDRLNPPSRRRIKRGDLAVLSVNEPICAPVTATTQGLPMMGVTMSRSAARRDCRTLGRSSLPIDRVRRRCSSTTARRRSTHKRPATPMTLRRASQGTPAAMRTGGAQERPGAGAIPAPLAATRRATIPGLPSLSFVSKRRPANAAPITTIAVMATTP